MTSHDCTQQDNKANTASQLLTPSIAADAIPMLSVPTASKEAEIHSDSLIPTHQAQPVSVTYPQTVYPQSVEGTAPPYPNMYVPPSQMTNNSPMYSPQFFLPQLLNSSMQGAQAYMPQMGGMRMPGMMPGMMSSMDNGFPLYSTTPDGRIVDLNPLLNKLSKDYKNLILNRELKHKCTWEGCSYATYKAHNLTSHMRKHTGEKPFACTFEGCSYRCAHMANLRFHENVHKEEKPFKCSYPGCTFTAGQRGNLRSHEKKVHEGKERHQMTQYLKTPRIITQYSR